MSQNQVKISFGPFSKVMIDITIEKEEKEEVEENVQEVGGKLKFREKFINYRKIQRKFL